MVDYPTGPYPPVCPSTELPTKKRLKSGEVIPLRMLPGEGINAAPFEAEKILDLTFPPGGGSGIVYGIIFQLGKWGFDSAKVDHWIDVSPVFTEYYTKTMEEKRKLEGQIKSGFASLAEAIKDFELISHDLRKYKEYLNYFEELERAKKENDEEGIKKAQHMLKAIFVDQVDAHNPEGVSLRSIAPRWPTIISDFMAIADEDDTPDKIKDKLGITKPEAVILATKNKLFVEWKKFFLETIKGRYERLKRMYMARLASIKEYREEIRPLLSRYKALTEGRERGGIRGLLKKLGWYRPDAQAVSVDFVNVWAWRPFVIEEVFKAPRETYTRISLKEAGFNDEEIKELSNSSNPVKDVPALPVKPIMDKFVRGIIKQINEEYGEGIITVSDVVDIINELSTRFMHPMRPAGVAMGPRWPFSPYYIFIEIPILRTVIKLPNGSMLEDIWIEPMKAWNVSQNIMIGRLLEMRAKLKAAEREISTLLGEFDPEKFMEIDKILKEEYPDLYLSEEEKKKKEEELEKKKREERIKKITESFERMKEGLTKIRSTLANLLSSLGIQLMFLYPGPYEKFMHERMSKMMQRGPGLAFLAVDTWFKKSAKVPTIGRV